MKQLEDGLGGSPTSSLKIEDSDPDDVADHEARKLDRLAQRQQRQLKRTMRLADDEALAAMAETDDAALELLWERVLPDAEAIAAKSAKFNRRKKADSFKKAMNKHEISFRDHLSFAYEVLTMAVRGEGARRFTGQDSNGNAILFKPHFRYSLKKEFIEFRSGNSHSRKFSRRTFGRWSNFVKAYSGVGQVTFQAIDDAREAVKNGEAKLAVKTAEPFTMTLETFDDVMNDFFDDREAISLDAYISDDEDDEETVADSIVSTVFDLQESTPEGRIAEEALDRLSDRKRSMFERAHGLTGKKEPLIDIGADFGISGQAVGQQVRGVQKYIAGCIEEYRFANGLPALHPDLSTEML